MIKRLNSLGIIIKVYWETSRLYTILFFMKKLFTGSLMAINSIYLLKIVFELMDGMKKYDQTIGIICCIIILNIINIIFGLYFDKNYSERINLEVKGSFQKKLYEKALSVDLAFYDNPNYYDDYNLMIKESATRPESIMEHLGALVYSIVNLATVFSIVLRIDWIVVVIIVVSITVGYFSNIINMKMSVQCELEMSADNKKLTYYKRIFYLKEYIKEIKTMKDISFIINEYDSTVKEVKRRNQKYGKRIGVCKFINGIVQSFLVSFAVYFVLVYDLIIKKVISIGDFSALLGSIWNLTDQLTQLVSHISIIYGDVLYTDKITAFFMMETTKSSGSEKIPDTNSVLELKNVSFSYDGERNILQNISLRIQPGQKVAIVGENGAGKTTLVNLIMGLYSNYTGDILLNGKNIKTYMGDMRKSYFSCLSQDFNIYAYSVKENVCMGECYSEDQIIQVLEHSGFSKRLQRLPKGVDTVLSREYDKEGIELSGGEKHMVAMARVLATKAKIVCLDEPSSDLDPKGEKNFTRLLLNAFSRQTVIFVSHRFFLTRNVDKIYMLSNGSVIEQGTHEELMKMNGRYAEIYRLQEKKYL